MSQPVKLSDSLVMDARLTSEWGERSIAGQIEFWAGLGRAIEPLMRLPDVLALRKAGTVKSISACLAEVGTAAGARRVTAYLKARPYPHYESVAGAPGLLVRIDEDGTRTKGRFVNRQFKPTRTRSQK